MVSVSMPKSVNDLQDLESWSRHDATYLQILQDLRQAHGLMGPSLLEEEVPAQCASLPFLH